MAIDLVSKFLPVMDGAFSEASKTQKYLKNFQVLNSTTDARKFKIAEPSFGGNKAFNRDGNNTASTFGLAWKEYEYTQDRYSQIYIDNADNMETLMVAFKAAVALSLKENVHEADAYRFYKMASGAKVKSNVTVTSANIITEINAGLQSIIDNDSDGSCVIFINTKHYSKILGSTELQKMLNVQTNTGAIDTRVASYNGCPVEFVSSKLMKKLINLDGGSYFENADASGDINIIVIDMNAFMASAKLAIERIFAPTAALQAESGADAISPPGKIGWTIESRMYHDAWIFNKQTGKVWVNEDATNPGT